MYILYDQFFLMFYCICNISLNILIIYIDNIDIMKLMRMYNFTIK